MTSLRSALYLFARLLGDFQSATKGPVPFLKRRGRAKVYSSVNGQVSKGLKKVGLG